MTKLDPGTVQESLETTRLHLRAICPEDVDVIHPEIMKSLQSLSKWLPWAREIPKYQETANFSRTSFAEFHLRTKLTYVVYTKEKGHFAGLIDCHEIDWSIPKCSIGYWQSTSMSGNGYMTEALEMLSNTCLSEPQDKGLGMKRVEIMADSENLKSQKVALRAGFIAEGILRNYKRDNQDKLCNISIFSKCVP